MKPELQIKALAELDGLLERYEVEQQWLYGSVRFHSGIPNYLTSYDAIIPLIQKLREDDKCNPLELVRLLKANQLSICCAEHDMLQMLMSTPPQLCEALLRATNKWIEE